MTYFVIESYVKLIYKWQFGEDPYFELTSPPQLMTTDKLNKTCFEMSTADFPVNKNMCGYVTTTYGEYDVYSLRNNYLHIFKTQNLPLNLKNVNMSTI